MDEPLVLHDHSNAWRYIYGLYGFLVAVAFHSDTRSSALPVLPGPLGTARAAERGRVRGCLWLIVALSRLGSSALVPSDDPDLVCILIVSIYSGGGSWRGIAPD